MHLIHQSAAVMGDKRGAWRIGGYVADELIGHGASAQVWRGHVGRTSEPVALKVLDLADSSAVRAARTEAALLSTLDHPHLVQLRELVPDGQSVVLVLELAVGGSLADVLLRRGRLSPGEVVGAISPIAAALAYAHDQDVVHSDVAPANILFRADGSPVLADLGVARLLGGNDPPRSTLAYVDPEVAAGGMPSPASDVFMAAATALHALTGMPPWRGSTVEAVLAQACAGQIDGLDKSLAAVPQTVADVIRRGLSCSPAARGTAAAFALDLRHAASPIPIDLNAGRPREGRSGEPSGRTSAPRTSAPGSAGHRPRHAAPVPSATSPKPSPKPSPEPPLKPTSPLRPGRPEFARSGSRRPELDRPSFARPDSETRASDCGGPELDQVADHRPPLALTHIVRARVRAADPTRNSGPWTTWRSDGRLRIRLALATVVLLAASGLAWLRWGPAWPRAATAAPAASTATAAGPSGSVLGAPLPASDRPVSRASASIRDAPTRRELPTTAPTPSAGGRSASRSTDPDSVGDAHWSAVLGQLDRHRQTAFATDDPAPLSAVYVPGTLLQQDVAALHQVVGPSCRLIGLRTRYLSVHVTSTMNRSVVLTTQASLDAASLQCSGAPARMLPAHRTVPMTVVLVPNGGTYLISGINVSV